MEKKEDVEEDGVWEGVEGEGVEEEELAKELQMGEDFVGSALFCQVPPSGILLKVLACLVEVYV